MSREQLLTRRSCSLSASQAIDTEGQIRLATKRLTGLRAGKGRRVAKRGYRLASEPDVTPYEARIAANLESTTNADLTTDSWHNKDLRMRFSYLSTP